MTDDRFPIIPGPWCRRCHYPRSSHYAGICEDGRAYVGPQDFGDLAPMADVPDSSVPTVKD